MKVKESMTADGTGAKLDYHAAPLHTVIDNKN
jgi:hypothetical protein